jgi:hypothetical protein
MLALQVRMASVQRESAAPFAEDPLHLKGLVKRCVRLSGWYEAGKNVIVVVAPVVVWIEGLVVLVLAAAVYELEEVVVVQLVELAHVVCWVAPSRSLNLAAMTSFW